MHIGELSPVRLVNLEDEQNTVTLTRTEYTELIRNDERLKLIMLMAADGAMSERTLRSVLEQERRTR